MPLTYIKIASVTVGAGGASSIDFTSIPNTYTDLCLLSSLRTSDAGSVAVDVNIKFNGSDTNKTILYFDGTGSSVRTGFYSFTSLGATGAGATSNTFANSSLYIPNYAGSTNKSFSIDYAPENNATTNYYGFKAGLWASTAAINQLTFVGNFVQYSTATLYGILKA